MALQLLGAKTMAFDGNVGDLGSGSGPAQLSFTWTCRGHGTEEAIRAYAAKTLQGKEILSQVVSRNADGSLTYTARVNSRTGMV